MNEELIDRVALELIPEPDRVLWNHKATGIDKALNDQWKESFREKARSIIKIIEEQTSERDEVIEKAHKLSNNVGGVWTAFGEDLRMGMGTTNYSYVKHALEAFDAAYWALKESEKSNA